MLRFKLPVQEGSLAPKKVNENAVLFILKDLGTWHEKYSVNYTATITDYHLYVEFERPADLSHFLLTFDPSFKSSGRNRIQVVDSQSI